MARISVSAFFASSVIAFSCRALSAIGLPLHREAVVRIDRPVLGRQVADMAVAGEHAMPAAQIFLDGLRLGGRFDDDELQRSGLLTRTRRGWGGGFGLVKRGASEADLAAGMAVEPAGEVEFEQHHLHRAAGERRTGG